MALSGISAWVWMYSGHFLLEAPLIVAVAVWQYSYHVLAGLGSSVTNIDHCQLEWTMAWFGWLLNLNGSLTKMGVKYSTIWSEDFKDKFFLNGIRQWLRRRHDHSRHAPRTGPRSERACPGGISLGVRLAKQLKRTRLFWGSLMKAAWACTTPSSMMNC